MYGILLLEYGRFYTCGPNQNIYFQPNPDQNIHSRIVPAPPTHNDQMVLHLVNERT